MALEAPQPLNALAVDAPASLLQQGADHPIAISLMRCGQSVHRGHELHLLPGHQWYRSAVVRATPTRQIAGSGTCTATRVIRRESKKLIKPLNIYHQVKRIQEWEVNDPERSRGRKYHPCFSNTFDIPAA